ncbi:MAG: DNA polymerase I, partial [Planctomycetes bacterium]|nr:DNA polymerase I [Planctomycetota bacterium]
MSAAPCLMLVDGMSYLFRAFHALPPLTNSKGRPTGAVYGVANMLRRLRAEHVCEYFAVVFDAPGRTFRDDLYEPYKATRAETPADLKTQIQPLADLVRALGLPLLSVPGVEADDVIGTLARRAEARGMRVLMSTGDKDMAQLVSERITLVNTMDNRSLDIDGVRQKFGVAPERMIDWLTLVGDSVDNVPGVPKVGPKTAAKWLDEWGSLDALIAHADEVKGKVGENLRASLEQLPLSRELVTIRCDVALDVDVDDLVPAEPDRERLRELYTELE